MAVNQVRKYHPVWGLGFRPFFLLGSASAVILIIVWLLYLLSPGNIIPYKNPILWHAHEMLFGFTGAIIIGFLLTSSQNWSGIRGLNGQKLKYLTLLWLVARILPFGGVPKLLVAGVDLLFIPLATLALYPQLKASKKRNQKFFVLLGLLFIANLLTQFGLADIAPEAAPYGVRLGMATILLIVMVITGRIVPFFTKKVISDSKLTTHLKLEQATFISSGLFFGAYVWNVDTYYLSLLALPAFVFNLLRWLYWRPLQSLRVPILAILYAGYAWLIIGFFLQGINLITSVFSGLVVHAWTAGAIGVLVYGMVTRVALGHTGRKISSSKLINAGYVLINLAVFIRVIMPLVLPEKFSFLIASSGTLWSIAFLLLLLVYTPILVNPRLDGKEG